MSAPQLTNDALQAAHDRADAREADEWDELEKTLEPCPQCGPKGTPVLDATGGEISVNCERCGFSGPVCSMATLAAGEWNTRYRDDFKLVKAVKRFLEADKSIPMIPLGAHDGLFAEWRDALSTLRGIFETHTK